MKANQKVLETGKNTKTVSIILLVFVIGLAFFVVTSQAIIPILIGLGVAFLGGAIVGWWLSQQGDEAGNPNDVVTSEEDFVAVWNDFIESWNNMYNMENTHLINYMHLFNFTFIDQVRRAENEVSAFVSYTDWDDVEANMTTLEQYRENVTHFVIGMLHDYNSIDADIVSYLYDTAGLEYCYVEKMNTAHAYLNLTDRDATHPYKIPFGVYPTGFNGAYLIDDYYYITYIYVPAGKYITLLNTETSMETNYSTEGVYDLNGTLCQVTDVSTNVDYGGAKDGTEVYLWGLPEDFDVLDPDDITYYELPPGLTPAGQNTSFEFGCNKHISSLEVRASGSGGLYEVYINHTLFDSGSTSGSIPYGKTVAINRQLLTLDVVVTNKDYQLFSMSCPAYIYDIHCASNLGWMPGLRIRTDDAGTVVVDSGSSLLGATNLSAIHDIGIPWMVDSYVNVYDAMINQAHILWTLYHDNGWYNTSDIPSDYIVVPPDVIFDNLGALANLPVNQSQAIYYAWMYQLIHYYDEHPNSTAVFTDNNMTMYDLGILFNATLIHGNTTAFDEELIYISPLLNDMELCSGESYNLTQGLFIYEPQGFHVYYAYAGDNLTIHNITWDGTEVSCINLSHQTMSEYMLSEYGYNLSFAGEWVFPEVEGGDLYLMMAFLAIAIGALLYIFGRFGKEQHGALKILGILLVIAGAFYLAYIYILYPLLHFLGLL